MSLRTFLKKKLPATFNAAEYEANRVLNAIEEIHNYYGENSKNILAEMRVLQAENRNILSQIVSQIAILKAEIGSEREISAGLKAENEEIQSMCQEEKLMLAMIEDRTRGLKNQLQEERLTLTAVEEQINSLKGQLSDLKEAVQVQDLTIIGALSSQFRTVSTARVHFIRCLDIYNAGDMACGPDSYFKELLDGRTGFYHTIKNINYGIIEPNDWVILGGGGLFECNPQYQAAINHVLSINNHVIAWGVGHNRHHVDCCWYWPNQFPIEYGKFALLSSRDFEYENDTYCPCVSCMMPQLEKQYTIKRRVGAYVHHQIHFDIAGVETCPNSKTLEEVLEFIGSSEIIISNSYHGIYWATLMGKKVICYEPFSEKFDYFKYPPVVYSGDLERDISETVSYPDALEDCRAINIAFKNQVLEIM